MIDWIESTTLHPHDDERLNKDDLLIDEDGKVYVFCSDWVSDKRNKSFRWIPLCEVLGKGFVYRDSFRFSREK